MKIAEECVVAFHFVLKGEDGEVIEESTGAEPLVYLHGFNGIVPGLEEALTGRAVGDKFQVTLPPEKAYGERDERLMQMVPREQFPDSADLAVGMQFQVKTPNGPMIFTVADVAADTVTVDGNPEMAGKTLNFSIEVTDVRPATPEELEHGHAHGPGGHHHHS